MRLMELFDLVVDWKWTREGNTDVAHVDIKGKDIELRFGAVPRDGSLYISFYVDEDPSANGRGDAVIIFGAVVECISKYIQKHPVPVFWFTADADEPKRVHLYNVMCARLVRKIPYELTIEPIKGEEKYTFTRKS